MAIYTGRGDSGETFLPSVGPVSKEHPRVEVDGVIDELNTLVGVARPTGHADVDERLRTVQNHLHVLHADVTTPDAGDDHPRVTEAHVSRLEHWLDSYDGVHTVLCPNASPGGTEAGAHLHQARTVCQRAERSVVALSARENVTEHAVRYLNRLADVLFIFARVVNERSGRPEPRHCADGSE